MPYVQSQTISGADWRVNKIVVDAEALVLRPDGSGYIGDEYGPNVYYFNNRKEMSDVAYQRRGDRNRLVLTKALIAGPGTGNDGTG